MKFKEKSWIWCLTYPFAHNNYTLICQTLYFPKGQFPSQTILDHENIHVRQIEKHGAFKFYFLYLFGLPFFWNQFRFNVEYEAYKLTTQLDDKVLIPFIQEKYGWLMNRIYTGPDLDI